jgi:hypothetical protein
MARRGEDFTGPLLIWIEAFETWLSASGCSPARALRAVKAFGRFSSWMAVGGFGVADLNEQLIDEHIDWAREQSMARTPAAVQYLPLAKRFLAVRGVLVLRGPASRDLGGVPRRLAGALSDAVGELAIWLRTNGYAKGSAVAIANTAARLGAWMGSHKLDVEDLDDVALARFVTAHSRGRNRHPSVAKRIPAVRTFLIATGRLRQGPAPAPALDAVGQCLQAWGREVARERGAGQGWIREQARWVRGFLNR